MKDKEILKWPALRLVLEQAIGTVPKRMWAPENEVYYHFIRDDVTSIHKIVEEAEFISKTIKSIVILHYNPNLHKLFFRSSDFELEATSLKVENNTARIIELKPLVAKTLKLKVYVFDHNITSENPVII